jgi:hypothetical protein
MVIIVVSLPCHGVAWHDAIVPVVTTLLAWWWFTNCPVQCGLAVAFVIVSYSPRGVVATIQEQVAAPMSLVAFLLVMLVASTLDCEVEVPVGLVSLESQS